MRLNATTTQEKAWMLRAAYELTRQKTPLNILVNGKPAHAARRRDPPVAVDGAAQRRHHASSTRGDAAVWRTTSVQGTPSQPLPADGERPHARPRRSGR